VDDEEHVESILWRAPELCGEVLPGVSRQRIWSTEEKQPTTHYIFVTINLLFTQINYLPSSVDVNRIHR
jgi:hypothetical protein